MSPATLALQVPVDDRDLREEAARWYAQYRQQLAASQDAGVYDAVALTDADINRLVHELRQEITD